MNMRRWRRSLRPCCNDRTDRMIAARSVPNVAAGGKRPNLPSALSSQPLHIKGRQMGEALARHSMVKVTAAGWTAVMKRYPELASEPIVAGWAKAGRPLVVRRPACSDTPGSIPLGLPLPPSRGKRRIAISLAAADIVASAPPPLLADAADAAPAAWRTTIDLLLYLLPETRTYGSLAWQHLTGLPYLSDGSDLDLLWQLSAAKQAGTLLSDIARIAMQAPM